MSIYGSITLENYRLDFDINNADICTYTVFDTTTKASETITCGTRDFLCALSIAVHYDGTPDYKTDYEAAEKALRYIRWIP